MDENNPNNKWLNIIQPFFWIAFFVIPFITGILAYRWLPNESPIVASGEVVKPFEILSSHEECQDTDYGPSNCGTVADVWRNTSTGKIFTQGDFKTHRYNERNRMTTTWFVYGLIGCLFYAGIKHLKKEDFFRPFGIAVTINLVVTLYIYFTTRV